MHGSLVFIVSAIISILSYSNVLDSELRVSSFHVCTEFMMSINIITLAVPSVHCNITQKCNDYQVQCAITISQITTHLTNLGLRAPKQVCNSTGDDI